MVEISSIENQYMGRMRELDSFVRNTVGEEQQPMQIIDHDFAPEHTPLPITPDSLTGFSNELERLQSSISGDERNADTLRQNLASARQIIGVLTGEIIIGQTIDYADFVEKTMGLRPEKISRRDLRRQKNEITELVERLGYKYIEDDREDFNSVYTVGAGKLQEQVGAMTDIMYSDITKAMGKTSLSEEDAPRIEAVEDDDLWQGYFGYDKEKGFFIQANTHPLIRISLLEERAVLAHEGGHWVSSALKKRGIESGDLSPAIGIRPVFSPEHTQEEIIARVVESYLFSEMNSDFATYIYKKFKHINDVGNNMLINANSGKSLAEVTVDARMLTPFEEPDKTRKMAKLFSEKLLFKTVFAIDTHALRIGRGIASLPNDERKAELTKMCFQRADVKDLSERFQ